MMVGRLAIRRAYLRVSARRLHPKGPPAQAHQCIVTPVLVGVRQKLQSYYSEICRSSVDLELMMRRMLIVGYLLWLALGAQVDPEWNSPAVEHATERS
jgi:hypothetical protein